jgi:hypothetical protein
MTISFTSCKRLALCNAMRTGSAPFMGYDVAWLLHFHYMILFLIFNNLFMLKK